jgi:drug/metabolite transporter (DMT)-like permease
MNIAAAIVLALASLLLLGEFPVAAIATTPALSLLQAASSAAMFAFFFRLQVVGGPVYLSQIGYVAAAVGLASGSLLLGESYGALTWLGAGVVAAGVVMTTIAQVKR